jgi:hypothetical protein
MRPHAPTGNRFFKAPVNNPSVSLTADSSVLPGKPHPLRDAKRNFSVLRPLPPTLALPNCPPAGRLLKQALKQFALVRSGYMRNPAAPGLLCTREPDRLSFEVQQ